MTGGESDTYHRQEMDLLEIGSVKKSHRIFFQEILKDHLVKRSQHIKANQFKANQYQEKYRISPTRCVFIHLCVRRCERET